MGEELSVLVQLVLEVWAVKRGLASQRHSTPGVLGQMVLAGLVARDIQEAGCTMANGGRWPWKCNEGH